MFFKLVKFLEGKKTYIQAFAVWLFGAYQSFVATGGQGWKGFVLYLLGGGIAMSLKAGQVRLSKTPVTPVTPTTPQV